MKTDDIEMSGVNAHCLQYVSTLLVFPMNVLF